MRLSRPHSLVAQLIPIDRTYGVGRGDVVGLIQQFEDVVDEEKAEQDAVRMLKGKFDMNDFLEQIGVLQKMGSLSELVDVPITIIGSTRRTRRFSPS